jgi:hypothetical protein
LELVLVPESRACPKWADHGAEFFFHAATQGRPAMGFLEFFPD